MSVIPHDYIERCYAGWLGKLIGIRYGAPIEGWTYQRIAEIYGELDGYIINYKMFAADDDSNGPMIFIRALNDAVCSRNITPNQIAETWLNYAPYEHGFYWWGGYGNSTEHTAYLNLRSGIPAPRSGSIEQNGKTVAEQIGGQIFIDTWGLVCPGQPELAAELAGKAASVSHDGNGIYGGQFVAAAIALSFTSSSIRDIIKNALQYIPKDCEYAKVVNDIVKYYDLHKKEGWRKAFRYVDETWGYAKYPGHCHIIPNAAVMILALMYGEEDFDATLNICNMCGWDTDCNVGNVGTIMGVFCGLNKINYDKWRAPINDVFVLSSVLGCLNMMEVPFCVAYLADIAYRLAEEKIPDEYKAYIKPQITFFHFRLPGSTQGFNAYKTSGFPQDTVISNNGDGALQVKINSLNSACSVYLAKRTYYIPEDFHDNRYDPSLSPRVYPGQTVTASVVQPSESNHRLLACIYVRDLHNGTYYEGEKHFLNAGEKTILSFTVPSGDMLINEMGVRIFSAEESREIKYILVNLKEMRVEGNANYAVDFSKEEIECFDKFHQEVSQCTYLKGLWTLEEGYLHGTANDFGECYTGDIRWSDYTAETTLSALTEGETGFLFRVQGAARSYAVILANGMLKLLKNEKGYRQLSSVAHETIIGKEYTIKIHADQNTFTIFENGKVLLTYTDTVNPYLSGCIGFVTRKGCHARWKDIRIY